jgi:cobalamin biosynthesis Co2+ chelatase CbiK
VLQTFPKLKVVNKEENKFHYKSLNCLIKCTKMIKLTKFFSNQYVIFKEFGKIYESNQINFFLNLAHSICVKNSLAIFYLLPYLATVNVFNSCLPKEEENVIFICHGTHKIRS